MKPARVIIPAVVIAAASVFLSHNVLDEWGQAIGFGQRAATLTQAAYGVLGVLAGIAALWRPRALGTLLGLWLLAITATGVLAPVVWGGQPWLTSFGELLERFAARPPDATWPLHPAFGTLSRRAWGVLGYRHVDHHFRQFGV